VVALHASRKARSGSGEIRARIVDELGYDPDLDRDERRVQLDELDFIADVPIGTVVAARTPACDGALPVAVARLGSGKLVIVADECPHDGGRISDGYVEGDRLVCVRHGWELVACAGRCVRAAAAAASSER
jgi:nitrite reductase/ring-hydroxylating ferredoxin subunit